MAQTTTDPAPSDSPFFETFAADEARIRQGGGTKAIERQHKKDRLTARERIARLVDPADSPASDVHRDEIPGFTELGLWSAYNMYAEHGGAPAAGVVTGVGVIHGRRHMIIANDATVKAGAFFPMTCKKIIRAQHIAWMARMPLVYLVDSAGVYLPLQEDVFPDTDDFGRIFYLNSVISADGIPQTAAIMGFCVAGGGYLPVLCDTLLMTEGSGLYLAGQALVKAAIGQEVSDEELGGASMHAEISGTIDFKEPDDESCLVRLREVLGKRLPSHHDDRNTLAISRLLQYAYADKAPDRRSYFADAAKKLLAAKGAPREVLEAESERVLLEYLEHEMGVPVSAIDAEASLRDPERLRSLFESLGGNFSGEIREGAPPIRDPREIPSIFTDKPGEQYDITDILACVVDARTMPNSEGHESLGPDFDEYKADYGRSIVTGYARIGGHACGIVANQVQISRADQGGGADGAPPVGEHAPRDLQRERRQGGPVHHGLQPAPHPARVHPRHDGVHGRARQRAGGHHPQRREDGQRDEQLRRAQDRADHRVELWCGQLRHVRARVRALPHARLAQQQVRRHGCRPGDGRARDDRGAVEAAEG
jgi:acetyl-CoA carboxylase carboxyltransferase component